MFKKKAPKEGEGRIPASPAIVEPSPRPTSITKKKSSKRGTKVVEDYAETPVDMVEDEIENGEEEEYDEPEPYFPEVEEEELVIDPQVSTGDVIDMRACKNTQR